MTTRSKHSCIITETIINYFPRYALKESGVIYINERPPLFECLLMGFQHVLTMFGGNVVAPLLIGFDLNTALFFSGLGTIIFYLVTRMQMLHDVTPEAISWFKVPSYVGSSFSFIAVVASATGYIYAPGSGGNNQADVAAGAILVCGLTLGATGLIIMFFGSNWVETVMPPVVTGTVVITIGLGLSSTAFNNASRTALDGWLAFATVLTILLVSVYAPGIFKRISILIGLIVGYFINFAVVWFGYDSETDYTEINKSHWFDTPNFLTPKFEAKAISIIVPVSVVLLAENLGHVKAVGATVQQSLDKYIGRAIVGDAIATIISASGGGPGTTTYAQNIGVMAVTKNFSTLVFLVAAVIAIFLSFIPKIGAVIHSIPSGVFGGLSIVLFGLVAVSGARIWVDNQVDFKDNKMMLVAGVPIIIGAAMHTTLQWGNFQLDGIGFATYSTIILYQLLRGWDSVAGIFKRNKKEVIPESSGSG